jgi:hypothetical protein
MPNDITVGDTFTIRPGCDKAEVTCRETFANFANFRGHGYLVPGIGELISFGGQTAERQEKPGAKRFGIFASTLDQVRAEARGAFPGVPAEVGELFYNGGLVAWTTGDNAGYSMEVKSTTCGDSVTPADVIAEARSGSACRSAIRAAASTASTASDCRSSSASRSASISPNFEITNYGRLPSLELVERLKSHCQPIPAAVPGSLIVIAWTKIAAHVAICTGDTMIHAYESVGRVVEHGYRGRWIRLTHSTWALPGLRMSNFGQAALGLIGASIGFLFGPRPRGCVGIPARISGLWRGRASRPTSAQSTARASTTPIPRSRPSAPRSRSCTAPMRCRGT